MQYKILQLGKFYPLIGGIEKVEFSLLKGLSSRGIRCDMLCANLDGKDKVIKINDNANLILCNSLTKIFATVISPSMVIKLRKICKEYDIIHIHHPDPMACLALYLSGYKGKVVLHWHSDIIKQKRLLKLFKPLQKWLIKRADIIVGTSPIYIKESPFLTKVQNKITSIPIAVGDMNCNLDEVNIIKNKYPNKKIIFSLGRLVEYKGFEYLIEAAKKLGDDYVVLIGGSGPLKEKLNRLIKAYNLEENVKLIGYIKDKDVPNFFCACDIFCFPSIYKTEAFGLVQIESMLFGKPIVATRIPGSGVSWVNKHGVSGLNVPICNSDELANAILYIMSNNDTYMKFSKNARKRYYELFTMDMMIDNNINVYEEILKTA